MLGIERDQNLGVAASDGSVRAVRLVDSGVGQPDIIENGLQLALRNFLAQHSFHLIAKARSFFHTQTGTRAHVQPQ